MAFAAQSNLDISILQICATKPTVAELICLQMATVKNHLEINVCFVKPLPSPEREHFERRFFLSIQSSKRMLLVVLVVIAGFLLNWR